MLSPRPIWIVVAAAASAVLVAVAPGPDGGGSPSGCRQHQAAKALVDIADAQAEAMVSQGRYGSYWLNGGDRTLEKLTDPIRTDGVADFGASNALTGGWQPHGLGKTSTIRSSVEDRVVRAGTGEVVRPECIASEAVASMLADLGVPRQAPSPAASAFDRPERAVQGSGRAITSRPGKLDE